MTLTHEELAAYADGELEGAEAARVLLMVAANPELMRMAQRYRALRERIGAEFAPILEQEVPERLAALLRPAEEDIVCTPKREPEAEARTLSAARAQVARSHEPPSSVGTERRGSLIWRCIILAVLAGALVMGAA